MLPERHRDREKERYELQADIAADVTLVSRDALRRKGEGFLEVSCVANVLPMCC